MRWNKPQYTDGQTRSNSGFLWFPKRIGAEVRWLEFATWAEEYNLPDLLSLTSPWWTAIKWI